MHGELMEDVKGSIAQNGSSPYAWGTLPRLDNLWAPARFIPICVGNSLTIVNHIKQETGSSPHTWGTLVGQRLQRHREQFIPAFVGNSGSWRRCCRSEPVHPHMRGELAYNARALSTTNGSSPRMWGTRSFRPPPEYGVRFIPTCVGNSLRRGC